MALPKKTWSKPEVRKLSESEVKAFAERHESVRELLKDGPSIKNAA